MRGRGGANLNVETEVQHGRNAVNAAKEVRFQAVGSMVNNPKPALVDMRMLPTKTRGVSGSCLAFDTSLVSYWQMRTTQ